MILSYKKIIVALTVSMVCMGSQAAQVVDAPNQKVVGQAAWQPQADVDPDKFININIPNNKVNLIFIRELDDDPKQTSANISINDRFQVSLQPNRYTQVFGCAGTNLISAEPTGQKTNDLLKDAKSFQLAASNTHFFYVTVDDTTGEPLVQQISADSAKQHLMNKKYQAHQISRVVNDCPMVKAALPVVVAAPKSTVTKVAAPEVLTKQISMELDILFDNDKAVIKPMYASQIQQIADVMMRYPTTHAIIEGHTDSNGTVEYNQSLSQQRAQAVVNMLTQQFGIDASRLAAIGHGELRPHDTNSTAAGRASNRRVIATIDETVTVTVTDPKLAQ